jgi:hypothetical protein
LLRQLARLLATSKGHQFGFAAPRIERDTRRAPMRATGFKS